MLSVIAVALVTCKKQTAVDWKVLYSDARQGADRHDFVRALDLATRGFQDTSRDPILNYQFRVLKAELLSYTQPTDALQLLEVDPPGPIATGEFPVRRRIVQGIACAYMHDFGKAHLWMEDARGLAKSGKPDLLPQVAFTEGLIAIRNKQKADAEHHYTEAVDLAERYGQKVVEADALNNLGLIEMNSELYDKAIAFYARALAVSRQLDYALAEQSAMGNMGWSYHEIGNFEQAVFFLKDAQNLAAKIGKTGTEALWCNDLGAVYANYEDYPQAENYYRQAFSLATNAGDNSLIMQSLRNLARLKLETKHLDEAEEYHRQALKAESKIPDLDPYWQGMSVLTTAEIAIQRGDFVRAEELLKPLSTTAENLTVLRRAHADLATIYVAQKKPREADHEFRAAIQTVEEARSKVKEEERRMSILDVWPFYDDYIHFLIHQGNARRASEMAEFSRARILAEGLGIPAPKTSSDLSLSKIQSSLRSWNKIILAYWLSADESYLWLITPDQVKSFALPPQRLIDDEIQAYSTAVLNHEGIEDSTSGQKLYEMLVAPAVPFMGRQNRIIVIPNRSLYKINFETLVVPAPKRHYWIEDATVEVAGSLGLLSASGRGEANPTKKLLLIGAPIQANSDFRVLHYANEEMEKVAAHFPPREEDVITGKDATPSAYASLGDTGLFQFIHFVTHGEPSLTSPLDSAIILSPQADGSFRLYAHDILRKRLNADLVTISACYGLGTRTYSGEGLVGLAWSFLRAGAHQVIAGLWEVDDRSAPGLMDNFYSALRDTSAAVALRKAKLNMLRSTDVHRLPFYWGSLQLYTGS